MKTEAMVAEMRQWKMPIKSRSHSKNRGFVRDDYAILLKRKEASGDRFSYSLTFIFSDAAHFLKGR